MRLIQLTALAFVSALFVSPAAAATVTCGGIGSPPNNAGLTLTITTAVGSSCLTTGNGNVLDGTGDPVNDLLYLTLDTTLISPGLVPLTFSGVGATSGSFSFTPDALYDSYVLGFQAFQAAPNPDYFAFLLAETITSGTWELSSGTNTISRAILYGRLAEVTEVTPLTPVPLPAALVLFGSALAGFFGFGRLRERFSRPAVA